VLTARLLTVT